MRVQFRPTAAADLVVLVGREAPHRVKAISAVLEGRVIGIGGVVYRPDGVFAFALLGDELRKYPAAVHRAGAAGMALIRDSGAPVVIAEAQPGNPAAERWLEHFGFVRSGNVFVWRRP